MPQNGALHCCKTACCVLIVFVNIISIILGVLVAIAGILVLWGSALIQSLPAFVESGRGSGAGTNQTGASLFGSGVSLENYYTSLAALSGSAAGLLIAFGIVIVVVSCIGCFGACIGVPACLIIYVVCVSLLFIGQLIVIIIWFTNSSLFRSGIRKSMDQQMIKYRGEHHQNFESTTLNIVQTLFGCCGVDNGTDFQMANSGWNRTYSIQNGNNETIVFNLTYPVSCCKYNLSSYKLVDPYCPYNGSRNDVASNHRIGCHEKVWQVIDTQWKLDRFFYGLCGCLGLELLLVVGAIVIYCAKKQQLQATQSHADVEYKMVPPKS